MTVNPKSESRKWEWLPAFVAAYSAKAAFPAVAAKAALAE